MITKIERRKRKKLVTNELNGIRYLLSQFPTGILSMVSDTYDLWRMCTEYLPTLKDEIMARNGKLVIRPDSGNPVDILCGTNVSGWEGEEAFLELQTPKGKGVIELLWDTFGGTINEQGYKVLDEHIGAIYGDSITLQRAEEICQRLEAKGFASTNVVLGIGSFTYQYNTRDTFGFAMKATYCEFVEVLSFQREADGVILNRRDDGLYHADFNESNEHGFTEEKCIALGFSPVKERVVTREIFKNPVTDDGTKKSATGLLSVIKEDDKYKLIEKCSWEQETQGELKLRYMDGVFHNETTLSEVRNRLQS